MAWAAAALAERSRYVAVKFTRNSNTTITRMAPKLMYSFLPIVITDSPLNQNPGRLSPGGLLGSERELDVFRGFGRPRFEFPLLHGIHRRIYQQGMPTHHLGFLQIPIGFHNHLHAHHPRNAHLSGDVGIYRRHPRTDLSPRRI